MPRSGKVDRSFFVEYIEPRLGATREDVRKGPAHGVDFGVIDVGDRSLVISTDPISILPALGFEKAGRFAMQFVLADVAVSGVPPSHLTISLALPPVIDEDAFQAYWTGIDAVCREHDVAIISGHTAHYPDASLPWIGSATAFGVGDSSRLVYPDGAKPGDRLLVTKGPAVEATGLLASLFGEQIDLDPDVLAEARNRLADTAVVGDALAAASAGSVSAMHDATEGGLLGAAFELAESSGVRIDVVTDAVPRLPGVTETCEALGMDPWRAGSGGTLLLAVPSRSVERVRQALESRGTPVSVAGQIEAGEGVTVDGVPADRPAGDSSWSVYEQFLDELE